MLTPQSPNRAGTAHVGEMVQVRLPTSSKWTYEPGPTASALSEIQPSGVLIHALNACVWSFQASATGAESLSFIGQAICQPGQPCAAYRIAMTFSVSVS